MSTNNSMQNKIVAMFAAHPALTSVLFTFVGKAHTVLNGTPHYADTLAKFTATSGGRTRSFTSGGHTYNGQIKYVPLYHRMLVQVTKS